MPDMSATCDLAGALAGIDEPLEPPVTVWWWDVDAGREHRGTLYGWRGRDGGREALILLRGWWDRACPVAAACVRWVPAEHVRARNE